MLNIIFTHCTTLVVAAIHKAKDASTIGTGPYIYISSCLIQNSGHQNGGNPGGGGGIPLILTIIRLSPCLIFPMFIFQMHQLVFMDEPPDIFFGTCYWYARN